jgi:regulator of sirC expression with transglutaminase-like and TPR domain
MISHSKLSVSTRVLEDLVASHACEEIPLDQGALAIAEPVSRNLNWQWAMMELDRLASEVADCAGPTITQDSLLRCLNGVLFRKYRFGGNERDYYNPDNSLLHRVLETRTGIPIALSLLVIEVGRRIGIELQGIGLPGHFMVGYEGVDGTRYFDPYYGGKERTPEECETQIGKLFGVRGCVDKVHFQPVSSRAFLTRMLNNLRSIYKNRGDLNRLAIVLRQSLLLNPEDPNLHAELATTLLTSGNPWEAMDYLETYLDRNPQGRESTELLAWVEKMRRRLAVLN